MFLYYYCVSHFIMDEQKLLKEGIEKVKMSGITKREFFQVDLQDAIRQEDRIRQQEEDRIRQEQEDRIRQEQEQEQSQSLFEIHERMAESEYRKRQFANFANLYKSFSDKKP